VKSEKDGVEITISIPKKLFDSLPKSSFGYECPKCKTSNGEGEALIFVGYLNRGTGHHPDFGTTYYWDDLIVCSKCLTVFTVHDGNP